MAEPILVVEAVDEVLDEKAISHLDFDLVCQIGITPIMRVRLFGIPLSVPLDQPKPCSAPAVALLHATCCGFEACICAAHRDEIAAGVTTICGICQAIGPTETIVKFHPLPGVR